MGEERRYLSAQEAVSLLNDGNSIHTFRNPGENMLFGADMDRDVIESLFKENDGKIEIGGPACRAMKHAIVLYADDYPLFIEHNEDKLNEIDPL